MKETWVPHDTRDAVVDFVHRWTQRAEIAAWRLVKWIGIGQSKFYDWRSRYGKVNEHNAWVPRDFWLEPWEKQAIMDFHGQYPLEGYRRLAFMMLDRDVVADVEIIIQRGREKFPGVRPRIISDSEGDQGGSPNPQFIAKDFKEFIRICGMTHVKTSPYYPQSNGKLERWHRSVKSECIRPGTPLTLADARRLVGNYVEHYNTVRLHSAIGYVTPRDKLKDRQQVIFAERDRKLHEAREKRKAKRQAVRKNA